MRREKTLGPFLFILAILPCLNAFVHQYRHANQHLTALRSGILERLFPQLSSTPPAVRAASTELADLLSTGRAALDGDPRAGRLDELIDVLVKSRAPFDVAEIGLGSLWTSRYTRGGGSVPRWKAQSLALQGLLAFENLSGQRYDLSSYVNNDKTEGTVLNYSELLGQALYLRAAGSFRPASGDSTSPLRCPVDFDVTIKSGGFVAMGREFSLPISGPGYLRVLYADQNVRIFANPRDSPDEWEKAGLIAVQIPATRVVEGRPGWVEPSAVQL